MIEVRKSEDRGHVNHGWLNTRHTFSFADYYDPRYMGFRQLRVINQDIVKAGSGFPMHPHRDMEIISYILRGQIEHRDSMGHVRTIKAGEVQQMSAGTGVRHSEYNPSSSEELELLQIWIEPDRSGYAPKYEEISVPRAAKLNQLRLIASPTAEDDSTCIHQDAFVYASILSPGPKLTHTLKSGRAAWVQLVSGILTVNGTTLHAGDGAAIAEQDELSFASDEEAEFLLFDLP